jgi:hypothetical protein
MQALSIASQQITPPCNRNPSLDIALHQKTTYFSPELIRYQRKDSTDSESSVSDSESPGRAGANSKATDEASPIDIKEPGSDLFGAGLKEKDQDDFALADSQSKPSILPLQSLSVPKQMMSNIANKPGFLPKLPEDLFLKCMSFLPQQDTEQVAYSNKISHEVYIRDLKTQQRNILKNTREMLDKIKEIENNENLSIEEKMVRINKQKELIRGKLLRLFEILYHSPLKKNFRDINFKGPLRMLLSNQYLMPLQELFSEEIGLFQDEDGSYQFYARNCILKPTSCYERLKLEVLFGSLAAFSNPEEKEYNMGEIVLYGDKDLAVLSILSGLHSPKELFGTAHYMAMCIRFQMADISNFLKIGTSPQEHLDYCERESPGERLRGMGNGALYCLERGLEGVLEDFQSAWTLTRLVLMFAVKNYENSEDKVNAEDLSCSIHAVGRFSNAFFDLKREIINSWWDKEEQGRVLQEKPDLIRKLTSWNLEGEKELVAQLKSTKHAVTTYWEWLQDCFSNKPN